MKWLRKLVFWGFLALTPIWLPVVLGILAITLIFVAINGGGPGGGPLPSPGSPPSSMGSPGFLVFPFPSLPGEEQPSDFAVISPEGESAVPIYPENYQQLVLSWTGMNSQCGIPFGISIGLTAQESNFGRNKKDSLAGAKGPYQFLPSTFYNSVSHTGYGIRLDGSVGNILDPRDAGPAADHYLCSLIDRFGKDNDGKPLTWAQAIRRAIFYYGGSQTRSYDPSDDEVVFVMNYARRYSMTLQPTGIRPSCSTRPSLPSDPRASIITDFGVTLNDFDTTHLQWVWEEFCNVSTTKFSAYIRGAVIEVSSLKDTQQVSCSGGGQTGVWLGQFPDKATFQVALAHELGHYVINCHRNQIGFNIFIEVHLREGGVSYYAQHARTCTDSDELSEDSADTIAYFLNPGMRRSMIKCESDAGIFTAPDLRSFPLHLGWANEFVGTIGSTTMNLPQVPIPINKIAVGSP